MTPTVRWPSSITLIVEVRDFAKGGLKKKFRDTINAIKTLRAIQAEGRDTATPEEQQILSKYVGWGQFPPLFDFERPEGEQGEARRRRRRVGFRLRRAPRPAAVMAWPATAGARTRAAGEFVPGRKRAG